MALDERCDNRVVDVEDGWSRWNVRRVRVVLEYLKGMKGC